MKFRTVKMISLTAAIALVVGIRLGGQAGGARNDNTSGAMPPSSIPTFSFRRIDARTRPLTLCAFMQSAIEEASVGCGPISTKC